MESLGLLASSVPPGPSRAATLFGAALGVRNACGAASDAVLDHAEARSLRASQPDAWARGQSMSLEEAIALGQRQGDEDDEDDGAAKAAASDPAGSGS